MTDGCPRNLCECDKRFAEAIANVDDTCETLKSDNDPSNDFDGDFCQKKEHYTKTSGKFFNISQPILTVQFLHYNFQNLKIWTQSQIQAHLTLMMLSNVKRASMNMTTTCAAESTPTDIPTTQRWENAVKSTRLMSFYKEGD